MDLSAIGISFENKEDKDDIKTSNPYETNREVNLTSGDFVTGEKCLLFSGPPTLDLAVRNLDFNVIKSIGLVLNASVQQSTQFVPWDELGIGYTSFIANKTNVNLSLGRARTNHNSFNYACYRWLIDLSRRSTLADKLINTGTGARQTKSRFDFLSYPGYVQEKPVGKDGATSEDVSNKHWDNIRSEFMLFPFGLYMIEMDDWLNVVSGLYFENCVIPVNMRNIGESPLILESINIMCRNVEPAIGLTTPNIKKYAMKIKEEFGNLSNATPPQ